MRIIKVNNAAFEKEKKCRQCGSIFAYTMNDVYYYTDMGGVKCPAVKCPVCGCGHDLEGETLPPRRYFPSEMDDEIL